VRCARAKRSQRDSEVYPRSTWITAKVTGSASVSFGVMTMTGRQGARSGAAFE
jgi:hypothetical protein